MKAKEAAATWSLPRAIITDSGPIDSKIILTALGFELADSDDKFHYKAVKQPAGWTIETGAAETNLVRNGMREVMFGATYSPFPGDENCLIMFG